MSLTDVALGGLEKAIDGLKNSIEAAFDFAQRAEKSSMALGMSFGQASDRLGGSMDGLRGDLNERFAAGIAGLEAGLQGNTAGIARLINQQRLTGTASGKTATVLAKLEMTLGLNREVTNRLADDMKLMSKEFQISSDNLVNALDSMTATLPIQALAGIGPEFQEAVASLQAELGSSMAGPLNSVLKMIMDTSTEGYVRLVRLGIGDVREQLAAAKTQEQHNRILRSALKTASEKITSFTADSDKLFLKLGIAANYFGREAADLAAVQRALGRRTKQEIDQTAEFANQLNIVKSEIFLPLQESFVEFFPVIKAFGIFIGGALKDGLEFLVKKVQELYVEFGGMQGIVETVKEKFTAFKDFIFDTAIPVIKTLAAVALVAFAYALGLATIAAIAIAIPLTKLAIALLPAALVGLGALVVIVGGLYLAFKTLQLVVKAIGFVFGLVKNAVLSFASLIGRLVSTIGSKIPFVGGALESLGDSISGAAESLKSKKEETLKTPAFPNSPVIENVFNIPTIPTPEIQLPQQPENTIIAEVALPESLKNLDPMVAPFETSPYIQAMYDLHDKDNAAKNAEAAQAARDKREKEKKDQELQETFNKLVERDNELFGFQERTADNTGEINRKTPEIETRPQYLDETANMLGKSIERILGITPEQTMEEMLEELKQINDSTRETADKEVSIKGKTKT